MTTVLKVDKGTAEKLIQWKELKAGQSKNLSGDELTLNIENDELVIEGHEDEYSRTLELSDLNGGFGLWVELSPENVQKIRKILDKS